MPARPSTSDLRLYLRLLGYAVPYWRQFVLALASMLVLAATAPVVAWLLKPALDDVLIARDADMVARLPVIVIALFALRGIASYFSMYSLHWVANRVVMDLRAAMFRRLLALPARYFDAHSTGGLVSRFTYDVAQLRLACTEAVTAAVRDSLYV